MPVGEIEFLSSRDQQLVVSVEVKDLTRARHVKGGEAIGISEGRFADNGL